MQIHVSFIQRFSKNHIIPGHTMMSLDSVHKILMKRELFTHNLNGKLIRNAQTTLKKYETILLIIMKLKTGSCMQWLIYEVESKQKPPH